MTGLEPFPLTSLEIACGIVLGPGVAGVPGAPGVPGVAPRPPEWSGASPTAAFETAIIAALERPPCLVSFSGGRDSSAVLAVAVGVARREGLPLPIPATNRFPAVSPAGEIDWQELVVGHLGLTDWYRNEVEDELDCVGPVATEVVRRHGLLWPFNAFFHVPLLEAAKGGSLLTGIGGDEVLGGSRWARAAAVLSGRAKPRPRDAARIALALAPARVREPILRRRFDISFPWLRPRARRQLLAALARQEATEPFGWGREFSWWRDQRYWQVGERSLAVLAADADASIVHPFAEAGFAIALAALPRRQRFGNRTEAMTMLFGDVLPAALLERATKATFDGAFFNLHSRRLLSTWNGEGADPSDVDVEALRALWSGPEPDARSFLLLQAAALARLRLGVKPLSPSIG